jgi:ribosome biogenesis GTPase
VPDRSIDRGQTAHEREKVIRKVRRQLKRNRGPKRTRDRSWTRYAPEVYEELDVATEERVAPRGERERRKRMLAVITEQLTEEGTSLDVSTGEWDPGVVVRISSGLCEVSSRGQALACSVRGSLTAYDSGYTNVVAVGDDVLFSRINSQQGVIERVQPRRTCLSRPDVFYGHLRQVIVANVDQLLIVSSLQEPAIWFELIDRYLIAAAYHGLTPIICLNKVDLTANEEEYRRPMEPYLALGHEVLYTSVLTGQGLAELRSILQDSGTVLAGLSGVGKSSLLNGVQPGMQLKTGLISTRHHEGRHTTAQVSLLPLAMGGYVVDTPGIREFGLWDVSREEVADYFPEISGSARGCHFPGCSHIHEPGCAIKAAVDRGDIAASRYDSYVKIRG